MDEKTNVDVDTPSNMCVPIYDGQALDDDDGVKAFIGTGTLIGYREHLLLMTARHCLDEHPIIAVGGFNPPLLMRRSLHNEVTTKTTLDLEFIDLGRFSEIPRPDLFKCIMWSSVSKHEPCFKPSHCRIFGYPATNNSADIAKETLNTNLVVVDVAEDVNALKYVLSSEIKDQKAYYIGMRYDPRLLEPSKKKRPKIKSFNGFSGGAIWRLGMDDISDFIGIMCECHSPEPTPHGEYILYGINVLGIDKLLKERYSS